MASVEASKKFGVGSSALRRWCKEFEADPTQAFPRQGKLNANEEKVRKLTEENQRLRQECDILKKATVFYQRNELKLMFIQDNSNQFPVSTMCRVLEVKYGSYYAWRSRPESQRNKDNQILTQNIISLSRKTT